MDNQNANGASRRDFLRTSGAVLAGLAAAGGAADAVQAQSGQAVAPAAGASTITNKLKLKLMKGQQVLGGTVFMRDPAVTRAMAAAGWDYLWIEMQHGRMSWETAEDHVLALAGSECVPIIRVPDATEGDIQKALDLGAQGVIIPMVEEAEEVQRAIRFGKFPPMGRRSGGGGPSGQVVNDNLLTIVQIESPSAVKNLDSILAVKGIDIIFAASGDLSNSSVSKEGEQYFESLVTTIHDKVIKAGLWLGGPMRWTNRRDFLFFQGDNDTSLLRAASTTAIQNARTASYMK